MYFILAIFILILVIIFLIVGLIFSVKENLRQAREVKRWKEIQEKILKQMDLEVKIDGEKEDKKIKNESGSLLTGHLNRLGRELRNDGKNS